MTGGQLVGEESLVAENEMIRDWARDVAPADRSRWDFLCECGVIGCNEHVKLTLGVYDALRYDGQAIVAPGHIVHRARTARAWAREVQAEATAVRNQSEQQLRRSDRLRQLRRGPYTELICSHCGYGVCVPEPPRTCPVCHSEWRDVHS